jgi:hypothetical protein
VENLTVAERQVLAELDRLGISQAGGSRVFTDIFEKMYCFLNGQCLIFCLFALGTLGSDFKGFNVVWLNRP